MQTAADILMIRPAAFGANAETAASNAFQRLPMAAATVTSCDARLEFDGVVRQLRDAGVRVHVFDDTADPVKPDAVFPNNWVSFHADGMVVLFPMLARSRRVERRMDLLGELIAAGGFRLERLADLTHHELADRYLEGTGSVVLDRRAGKAYACMSPRTHREVLDDLSELLAYEPVSFDAFDRNSRPIYHTNVLLALGTRFAAVCLSAIAQESRARVRAALEASGREIVELSLEQLEAFAGNMIELGTAHGRSIVAMSARARESLSAAQIERLETLAGPIVAPSIPTIEHVGGGSVRCMIAEVFLPRGA